MSEPAIISALRNNIPLWPEGELVGFLENNFGRLQLSHMLLNNNISGQQLLGASLAYALDKGWVAWRLIQEDKDFELYSFTLTDAGRAQFLS